jgi:hypothetical protein
MTREEAGHRAAALNADGGDDHWFTRTHEDGWEVVKVSLPASVRLTPLKEAVGRVP